MSICIEYPSMKQHNIYFIYRNTLVQHIMNGFSFTEYPYWSLYEREQAAIKR